MKLYYIKCDDFICDVTDRFDHAQELIKEYQQDDGVGKYKLQYSEGSSEIIITWFNKDRMKKFLNLTNER
tara:strand:+ start:632 stop:841 length:210 start_codon:yes stop_codon:yes gene_type:complete